MPSMKLRKSKWRTAGQGCAFGIALGVLVVASPVGRVLDRQLSAHFSNMNERRARHRLTWADGVQCLVLYNSIAIVGRLESPEGGAVVWHYLHGGGADMWLDSSYLRTSLVITKSLRTLKVGQSAEFGFHQCDDWRLSYALNPFSLRRGHHDVLLWQRLAFATNPSVKTVLNYGLGQVELPDGLIHALHPVPYTVYSRWAL